MSLKRAGGCASGMRVDFQESISHVREVLRLHFVAFQCDDKNYALALVAAPVSE